MRLILPIVGAAATVLAWWLAVRVFNVQPYVMPSPQAVASALADQRGYLADAGLTTLEETLAGFALTVLGGVLLGGVLSMSRWVEQALSPVLVALNSVPKLALSPMLLVWFGIGASPKIVMVVLVCFFPVVLSTITGLTSTPAELVEMAESLCGSWWQTFVKIRLKAALPQMFLGFKTAMPLAVIGATIAEIFAANNGLGFIIQSPTPDKGTVFAAIVVLSVMSIVLYYLVVLLERLMLPWVRHTVG
ncbi:MAG: ABC transporter permease [Micromonosporaceae bacterium]|nr:ABC transporter permease [Micromonosporaceae bacterium]